MIKRLIGSVLVLIVSTALASCVTVTESRLTKKKSPEKAVENYTQLGLGYLNRNRPDLARKRLQKALSIDEDYAPANDAMGLLWQSESEFDLAEEFFKKAINEDSSFLIAQHHLGRLYTQLKRYDDAEEELREVAEDPYYENRASASNDLARNYYLQGKTQETIQAYGQTLRISPYNADALVNISTLLFEAQRFDESQKYFDRLARMVGRQQAQHSAHSLWLGIKLANIHGNPQRAANLASELKRSFPQSREYRLYRQSLSGVAQ
ncbi:MAG: hypothetical protein CMI02_18720 [Oceanospirillaceae bacterium]|nr:hypothetical protein [Oceanospirillaceae bacterium]MBT14061.1 hypothetical protein [Oceanospirillaceae bacterium]